MTIRCILVQGLEECFREKIDESCYLFVKRETENKLIGCASHYPSTIQINGIIEPPEVLLSIESKSIKGMAVVTEKVTYWFRIENDNCFEICSESNLIEHSSMKLLKLTRTDFGGWVIKRGHLRTAICNPMIVDNDYEMVQKVFEIIANFGNPYNREEASLKTRQLSNVYQINVEDATLNVNGAEWLCFPEF